MIKEHVTLDETIKFLNSLLEIDRPAIAALLANRVPCNETLAKHSTVQVGNQHGGHHVGMLGILNGLFGVDDKNYGPISAVFELEDEKRFGSLLRFEKNQHNV